MIWSMEVKGIRRLCHYFGAQVCQCSICCRIKKSVCALKDVQWAVCDKKKAMHRMKVCFCLREVESFLLVRHV